MTRPGRAILAVLIAFFGLGLPACSLSPEESPRAIDKTKLPAIMEPNATTTTSVPADQGKWGFVCFVRQPTKNSPAKLDCPPQKLKKISAESLFEALVAGPGQADRDKGYSSTVPEARMLGASNISDSGVMTINLSEEISDISSPNDITVYHQIVKTLTDPRNGLGVRAIALKVEGESKRIPTDNGPKRVATDADFDTSTSEDSTP